MIKSKNKLAKQISSYMVMIIFAIALFVNFFIFGIFFIVWSEFLGEGKRISLIIISIVLYFVIVNIIIITTLIDKSMKKFDKIK